jgi:zinc transport system ATP-binding protein
MSAERPNHSEPAIEIRGLEFSYNGRPALRDVDLTIRRGNFTALIGPNGGGKTTLLKLMLGLLTPDRGTVRILGRPPAEVVVRVGYVPQDLGRNQRFPVTVRDVVLTGRLRGRRNWLRYGRADRDAARRTMERLEILDLRNRRIGDLSGGQRQRVYIARALVSDPEILFLDEPTASVDAAHQTEFYELLRELNRTVTILIVNHDLMVISSFVQSVVCVNRTIHYHDGAEVTDAMMSMYHCPVELVAHGIPHRVLKEH